jgi:TolB-like protein/Tfp pilus assembly protein PilF
MPESPNKLSQFWQELKRRKVVRVITIYAAVAFVILQLVEILAPSLRLPDWTMNFILVLLIIGFIITVIVSWIYDIRPEGGIVKTEPAHKVKPEEVSKSSNSWRIASYISFVVIVGLIVYHVLSRNAMREDYTDLERSIAVLPFDNLSSNEEHVWFSDGITDVIINQLSKISDLRVLGRTSTLKYKDKEEIKSITEIGEELGVNFVIEGTVQRQANQMRISVQLVRAINEDHLWSEIYDREWKEIFIVQEEIAQLIAAELEAIITPKEKELIEKKPTENLEAYDLYLRGRYFWNTRTESGLLKARDFYEKAIEKDPDYALAYAGLADSYILLPYYTSVSASEAHPKAKEYALKALSLDKSPEAYTSLAQSKALGDWDWRGAEIEFKRAIKLEHSYPIAHHWYSNCLMYQGRFDEAFLEIQTALEMNPLSLIINRDLGELYYYNRQYDEARKQYLKTMEIDPDFIFMNLDLGRVYLQEGMYDKALVEFQNDSLDIWIGITYALMDRRDKAWQILSELEIRSNDSYVSKYLLSLLCFTLDEKDQGFTYLYDAYENHYSWMIFLKIEPLFDNIRTDPRYIALLEMMNLE